MPLEFLLSSGPVSQRRKLPLPTAALSRLVRETASLVGRMECGNQITMGIPLRRSAVRPPDVNDPRAAAQEGFSWLSK